MEGDNEVEVADVAEVVTQTAAAAENSVERGAIETAVGAGLASIFTDGDEELVDAPAARKGPPVKPPVAKAAEPAEETAEDEAEPAEAVAAPATLAVANPAAAVVPAAYRRSLKALEWSDEEIDAGMATDPASFLKTAAKLHESRNASTQQMAELGRQLKAQQAAEAAGKTASKRPDKFTKIDVDALKAEYGDQAFIKQLEGLNGIVDFANDVMPWMAQSQKRQQEAELETLGRQIDGYFGHADMKDYHDLYGKTGNTLKDGQMQARQKVIDTADMIVSGAQRMGRQITLEEALTMAHDSVSAPTREKVAKAKIVTQVQKRAAAISLKPGGRAAPVAKTTDRTALQTSVAAKLAAAFK